MRENLNSSQVRKLKSLAHHLEPSCRVGKNGLSEGFLNGVREALNHHELIKVKFDDFKDQKKELAPVIAEKTESNLVTIVGNVAVLYRQHPNLENRKVEI